MGGGHTMQAFAAGAAAAVTFLAHTASTASSSAGSLSLRATLATVSAALECPSQFPSDADCRARKGRGSISGLGSSSSIYTWSFATSDCPSTLVKPLATTGRIVVTGKGEIEFALAAGKCVDVEPVRNEPQDFTITGGTGAYQGASGRGAVERSISGGSGVERWNGTLAVSGLEFDLTPPTIVGAISRTVRAPAAAKRTRVTYKVTARDAVDGSVAVRCRPSSGAFFKIGRTPVSCAATDTSGNARTTQFVITVRR